MESLKISYQELLKKEQAFKLERDLFISEIEKLLYAQRSSPEKKIQGYELLSFVDFKDISGGWMPQAIFRRHEIVVQTVIDKMRRSRDLSHCLNSMIAHGNISVPDFQDKRLDGTKGIFKKIPAEILEVLKAIVGDNFKMPMPAGTMVGRTSRKILSYE